MSASNSTYPDTLTFMGVITRDERRIVPGKSGSELFRATLHMPGTREDADESVDCDFTGVMEQYVGATKFEDGYYFVTGTMCSIERDSTFYGVYETADMASFKWCGQVLSCFRMPDNVHTVTRSDKFTGPLITVNAPVTKMTKPTSTFELTAAVWTGINNATVQVDIPRPPTSVLRMVAEFGSKFKTAMPLPSEGTSVGLTGEITGVLNVGKKWFLQISIINFKFGAKSTNRPVNNSGPSTPGSSGKPKWKPQPKRGRDDSDDDDIEVVDTTPARKQLRLSSGDEKSPVLINNCL